MRPTPDGTMELKRNIYSHCCIIVLLAICSTCNCLIHYRLERAVLPCDAFLQVSSVATPDSIVVTWESPPLTVIVSSNSTNQGRFTLLPSQDYSLQITDLEATDANEYRCIAEGVQRILNEAPTQAPPPNSNSTTAAFASVGPIAGNITEAPLPPVVTPAPSYTDTPVSNATTVLLEVREPSLPGQPYPVLDGIQPESITLTWEASDGPVQRYAVHFRTTAISGIDGTVDGTAANMTSVGNLRPFTEYIFQVEAQFVPGYNKTGPSSDVIKTEAGTPLEAPTSFTAVVEGPRQIRLTWAPPPQESLQGVFENYVAKYQETTGMGSSMNRYRSTENTSYVLTEVRPFSTYTLSVAVRNTATMASNIGPYSNTTQVKTEQDVPGPPYGLRIFATTESEIVILWSKPREENGIILMYTAYIEEDEQGVAQRENVESTVHAFQRKKPYTQYTIHVSASTIVGEGPNATVSVRTDVKGASKPRNLMVSNITNSSALLTWDEPTVFYKSVDGYLITIEQEEEMMFESVEFVRQKTLSDLKPGRQYQVYVIPLTISDKGMDVEGARSDTIAFRTLTKSTGPAGGTGTVAPPSRSPAGMVILILFLLLLVFLLLLLLGYYGIVSRKRQQMSLLKQQNGLRPIFAFSKPDELEEPPIPVDRFEEHVIANHADSDGGFATEYEDIQNVGTNFPAQAGHEDGNKLKNRYTNIVAYDHTRVCLQTLPGHPDSHYINANYIDSYNEQCAYIATQGPLKNTIEDFWRMVWEQNCHVIVMITKLEERGRRKCERYWPPKGMAERFRDIEVSLDGKEKFCTYILRTFHLKYKPRRHGKAQERMVRHYHYIDWPDHGVPSHTLPVLDFVLRSSEANPKEGGPIVVHCSAGVGRTGTYIVIDSMLKQIRDCAKVNVFGFLKRIRTQRNYLVQTEEQYVFIHDVLLEWVKAGDTRIRANKLKDYSEKMDLPNENGVIPLDVQHEQIIQQRIHAYQFMRARNPMNKPKNRSSQVLPVERGRVTITGKAGVENSDYINASFLPGYWHHNAFIVTQHPLEHTMMEFWKMLWEKNCSTVISLTEKEEGTDSVYWPTNKEKPLTFESLRVTLLEEELSNIEYVTRDFLVESLQDEDPLQIRQFNCSYWPEGCSPIHTTFDLIYAVKKHVKETDSDNKDMNGPIIVHDRCGGRQAGTFCALMALHEEMTEEDSVNVYKTIKQFAGTRVGMFNRKEDYHFLFRALASAYQTQKQLLTIERQKASQRKSRRIHRDWSFMVRSPVNTMEFSPRVERRGSLDDDGEFRGRSQTLGSTGRVARPTKFWHRRVKSEKPGLKQANGGVKMEPAAANGVENGQMGDGGELYELDSINSSETDRMLEREYPSDGDMAGVDPALRSPDLMITAADLEKDTDSKGRSSSTNSLDRLVAYRQEADKVHVNGRPYHPPPPRYEDVVRRPKSCDFNNVPARDSSGNRITYSEDYV